jgi:hypothetical protein
MEGGDFYNPTITALLYRGIVYLLPRYSTAKMNGCNFRKRVLEY